MKKRYLMLMCLCLAGAVIGVALGIARFRQASDENTDLESLRDSIKVFETAPPETEASETVAPETAMPETETAPSETETETADEETADTAVTESLETEAPVAEETTPPVSEPLLDFTALQATNPDIHAWIEIPGTKVDYPVLQSPDNDSKYLTTAFDGSYYIGGSLFTQATYNSVDFNDPVTVIYGHTMRSGTLFGQLQSVYTNPTSFAAHDDIVVYLPGEVRHYTVFAAVPFERFHLLHVYDFNTEYWYDSFFNLVSDIRAFNACFNKDIVPEYGDRVLILSTCLNEDSTRRFLVMAVCRDDIAEDGNGSR